MSKTGAARPLVLGPDVIPHIHRYDRRFVILVNEQGQPVGQNESLKGNIEGNRCGLLGYQRNWRLDQGDRAQNKRGAEKEWRHESSSKQGDG